MAVERASVAASPQPVASTQNPGPSSPALNKPDGEGMFTCQICFDDLNIEACRELGECAHKYCVGCMRSYLHIIATESKKFPIPCPDPSCNQALDPQLCIMALEGNDAELLSRLVVEKTHCRTMNYCANASCATPFDFEPPHPNASDDAWRIECPLCKTATCVRCKTIWHAGATCVQAKASSAEADELKELAKKEKWKSCPKCGEVIERISGCNYMRCRCGSRFCYACGTPYKNALRNNRNPHGTPGCDCGLIVPRREGGIEARIRMNMHRFYGVERRNMAQNRRNLERIQELRRRRRNLDNDFNRHRVNLREQAAAAPPPPPENAPRHDEFMAIMEAVENNVRAARGRFSHTASSVRPNGPAPVPAGAQQNRGAQVPNAVHRRHVSRLELGLLERQHSHHRGAGRNRELDRFRRYAERDRAFQTLAHVAVPPANSRRANANRQVGNSSPRNAHERDVANLPDELLAVRLRERRRFPPCAREVIDVDQNEPAPAAPPASPQPARAAAAPQGPRRILPLRRSRRVEGAMTLSDWLNRRRNGNGGATVDDSGDPPRARRRGLGPGAPWFAAPRSQGSPSHRTAVAAPHRRVQPAEDLEVIDVDEAVAVLEAPKKAVRFRTSAQEDSIAPIVPRELMDHDAQLQVQNAQENEMPPQPEPPLLSPVIPPELLFPQLPPQQQQREMQQQRERLHDWLGEVVNVQHGNGLFAYAPPLIPPPAQEQPVQEQLRMEQVVPIAQMNDGAQNNAANGMPDAQQFAPDVIVEVLSD